jgi:hypothetical protein
LSLNLSQNLSEKRQTFATALAHGHPRLGSVLQEFRDTALNDAQPESTSPIDFPIPKMDFVMDRLDLWRGHLYGAVCGLALD